MVLFLQLSDDSALLSKSNKDLCSQRASCTRPGTRKRYPTTKKNNVALHFVYTVGVGREDV